MILELLAQLRDERHRRSSVEQRLDQLLRRLYGPKGERFRPDQPTLLSLLGESNEPEPPPPPPPLPPELQPEPAPRKKGHGRRRLPDDLVRERIVHDLSEPEKICPCCQTPRVLIGEELSEQLDYRPAKLFVRQHARQKYACPACARAAAKPLTSLDAGESAASSAAPSIGSSVVVIAAMPAQPIERGLPGPGLLAHVITSKYADHLPLNRQEAMLARNGVVLSRSTLCDWMAAAAELLRPLYDAMLGDILLSRVIQTDETRVPVQDPELDKTKSGRLWVYVGDRGHPSTVYDYRPNKARDGPADVLKNYRGFLQADAASVFDGLYDPAAITEVGCQAHARRHFHDARVSDPARSSRALAHIAGLYAVEDEASRLIAEGKLTGDEADAVRLRLRREKTRPKLAAFAAWLEAESESVLPKSPIAQAIAYSRRHWQALVRFTEHGFLNIDNNASERALRAVAVGRKNWLFAGSDQGGCDGGHPLHADAELQAARHRPVRLSAGRAGPAPHGGRVIPERSLPAPLGRPTSPGPGHPTRRLNPHHRSPRQAKRLEHALHSAGRVQFFFHAVRFRAQAELAA